MDTELCSNVDDLTVSIERAQAPSRVPHVPGVPIDLRRPSEGGSVRRPDCCVGRRWATGYPLGARASRIGRESFIVAMTTARRAR